MLFCIKHILVLPIKTYVLPSITCFSWLNICYSWLLKSVISTLSKDNNQLKWCIIKGRLWDWISPNPAKSRQNLPNPAKNPPKPEKSRCGGIQPRAGPQMNSITQAHKDVTINFILKLNIIYYCDPHRPIRSQFTTFFQKIMPEILFTR